jgi:hypothetical protein
MTPDDAVAVVLEDHISARVMLSGKNRCQRFSYAYTVLVFLPPPISTLINGQDYEINECSAISSFLICNFEFP